MSNQFEVKRTTELRTSKSKFIILENDPETLELFNDRSYALVRNSRQKIMETEVKSDRRYGMSGSALDKVNSWDLAVILVPKKMTSSDWKTLFWMNVYKLVINGKELKGGLCGQCRKYLECVQAGIGENGMFTCVTSPKSLRFLTSRGSRI